MSPPRYRIEVARSAAKALRRIPERDRRRIESQIDGLQADPRPVGAKKLAGGPDDLYRIRQGHYRIVYQVRDAVLLVLVVRIGHRSDVYR